MRKSLGVAVLVLAFCCPVFAGQTSTPPAPPPPPDALAADGEIHTGVAESTPEGDGLAEIALDLLQSVLTLF
jgi:hypothetical protein